MPKGNSDTPLASQAQQRSPSLAENLRLDLHLRMGTGRRHIRQLMRAHAQGEDEKALR